MKKITLNKKRLGAVAVAAGMAFMPAMGISYAQSQVIPDKGMISIEEEKDRTSEYRLSSAVVDEIQTVGDITTIFATENNNPVVYKISDTIIYRQSTMEIEDASKIKEGDRLQAYFDKNAPMILIYPPQYPVKLIVIMDGEGSAKTARFGSDMISIEDDMNSSLKLNISEDTIIESIDGKDYAKDMLADKNLLVFYKGTTKSIPPQTNPQKIVVLPDLSENDGADNDQLDKDIQDIISQRSYYKGSMQMIPVAEIARTLGYEVKWISESKTVELLKDENIIELFVKENVLSINKKQIKITLPMEIKEGRTYAELSVLEILR